MLAPSIRVAKVKKRNSTAHPRMATFTPDGRLVLTASTDCTARLWNPDTGQCVTTMQHPAGVWSAVIDPASETILTVCEDGRAYLWNVQSGQQMTRMDWGPKGTPGSDRSVEFSPDGQRAVLAANDEAQVWDVRKGMRLATVKTTGARLRVVRFSPDGEHILTSAPTALVWEVATGKSVTPALDKRLGYWATLRFSPDGSHVLSGGEGLLTTIWDTRSGENVWPPLPANSELAWFSNGVRFSPEGGRIITGATDGTVRTWDLSPYQGSVADLKAITQVFSGRRIVGTTMIEPVEPEALQATFARIRLQRPEYFTASTNDVIAWHRRNAEDWARAGRDFAARWHANQLRLLTGDTSEFRTAGREQPPVR
ncbi:MAG: hypothetical protein L0Z50_13040 [Verrucomicrobiales bacterium]|nr:hypothetical protein [Verrucomicrobiales bacterium]